MALAVASRRKNLTRLMDAWQVVRAGDDGIELVLAGGTVDRRLGRYVLPDRASLELQGVRVIDHIPEADLPAVYSAATALVMPSLAKGSGLPPLEALCCGTPIVVSANSALVELGLSGLWATPRTRKSSPSLRYWSCNRRRVAGDLDHLPAPPSRRSKPCAIPQFPKKNGAGCSSVLP